MGPSVAIWPAVLVFFGVLALVGFVTLIAATVRRGSRWSELLEYARHAAPPRSLLKAQWIRVGGCRLKGCSVKVALGEEGLYLTAGTLVGPPLLVPWEQVRAGEDGGFLLGPTQVPLLVRGSLARRINDYLRPELRVQVGAGDPSRCPYCHAGLEGLPLGACVGCGTQHHAECLVEHGGCAVPGCDREPQRDRAPQGKELA